MSIAIFVSHWHPSLALERKSGLLRENPGSTTDGDAGLWGLRSLAREKNANQERRRESGEKSGENDRSVILLQQTAQRAFSENLRKKTESGQTVSCMTFQMCLLFCPVLKSPKKVAPILKIPIPNIHNNTWLPNILNFQIRLLWFSMRFFGYTHLRLSLLDQHTRMWN